MALLVNLVSPAATELMALHLLLPAVSQEETSEAAEGTVLRVVRRGFNLRDRLLRPATVVVAKAPETLED